jgi:hypothetical protein
MERAVGSVLLVAGALGRVDQEDGARRDVADDVDEVWGWRRVREHGGRGGDDGGRRDRSRNAIAAIRSFSPSLQAKLFGSPSLLILAAPVETSMP